MKLLDLVDLLEFFKREDKRVFSLKDAALYWNQGKPAAAMTLLRGCKNGLLWRVKNLWINRRDPPEIEELALALKSPSYISFESALYRHGILSQSPRGALSLATLGRSASLDTPLGRLRFIHLKPALFFGFDSQRMAYSEKAYLDALYMRLRSGEKGIFTEILYQDKLNQRQLKKFSRAYPASVQRQIH